MSIKHILDCKKMETAIRRAEQYLMADAKENGLYENFGEKEVREIDSKFINNSDYSDEMNRKRDELRGFAVWCRNVTRQEVENY